ncbi:MAG: serine/threonine protein kinase [Gemmataceae bacterium]|nr:serine/threonine protein kinase [Gemmataceae bacterium]
MASNPTVVELLLEWEERQDQGRPLTPEELCLDWPDQLVELRRQIRLLGAVGRLLELDGGPAAAPMLPVIPGFEILGKLGGGGMGVVYRARDAALDRVVAIKVPHWGVLTSHNAKARFEREARVLAQLRHPNIVPIHAAGLTEGQPYFVMDYVPQGSLADQLPRFRAQPERVTALVERVARAVHHAHQRGILHRDLKPSSWCFLILILFKPEIPSDAGA